MSAAVAFQALTAQISAILYEQRAELKAQRIVLQCALERLARSDPAGAAALGAIRADSMAVAARMAPAPGVEEAEAARMRAAVSASLGQLFAEIGQALIPPSAHGAN